MKKKKNEVNTEKNKSIRSPFFYVGDKYKLMNQLSDLFPANIGTFFDVFSGGGSAALNTTARKFVLNDINKNVIDLHMMLQKESCDIERFILRLKKQIHDFGLSLSEEGSNQGIEELKKEFPKVYFSKYNKDKYIEMRKKYNENKLNFELLYLLIIYGFNHMIRFNSKGEFNLPVGNLDWNKNVTKALHDYASWVKYNNVNVSRGNDFEEFVKNSDTTCGDFFYFDPPYLITFSEYNKFWNIEEEQRLYKLLDYLNEKGIKWGLSNMLKHKGKENEILGTWMNKYTVHTIASNYISRFDNTIKSNSIEVYVTNYQSKY